MTKASVISWGPYSKPRSSIRTNVSGCIFGHDCQVVNSNGISVSDLPLRVPVMAVPQGCDQTLAVLWSHHVMAFMKRTPSLPNVSTLPSSRRSWTSPVKQMGHHVTSTGTPPIMSLTISRLRINPIGNALDSPLMETPMTSSSGTSLASPVVTYSGV